MIKFDDNELEAAIITYNRPSAIQVTLEKYAKEYMVRNIKLSIYDSSEENDTFEVVREFNELHDDYVEYHRVDPAIEVGDKPIVAMLGSKCKYIWVLPDRRVVCFQDLDNFIFPKIREKNYKLVLLPDEDRIKSMDLPVEKEYDNLQECLIQTFQIFSCIGLSILKRDVFDGYNYNGELLEHIRNEFHVELDGYRYYGFIALAFSKLELNFKAYIHKVNIDWYLNNNVKSWESHFYRYVVGETIYILKYITRFSTNSDYFIKSRLNEESFRNYAFSEEMLYKGRVKWDLQEVYDQFLEKGFWEYSSRDKLLIEFYAKAPIEKVKRHYLYDMRHECSDNELISSVKAILPQLRQTIKPIYIYGAGHGGRIVLRTLKREKIAIAGFVDKNAKKLKKIDEISVFTLDEIKGSDGILIVSLLKILDEVTDQCIAAGFRDKMYYLCDIVARPEEYNKICNV